MLEALIYVLAVANVGFGVFGLCFPRRAARFAGFELADSSAFGEIRGVYGGLVIGLGVAMGWTARTGSSDGAMILLIAFAGLTVGRSISAVLDGAVRYTVIAVVLEAATVVLLWLYLRSLS